MKLIVLIFSFIIFLVNDSVLSQENSTNLEVSVNSKLQFLPNSISELTSSQIDFTFIKSSKQNIFLTTAGYLLQDLKFSSPTDRFNATAPFDIRGVEPSTFGNYSDYIKTNYLLLKPIQFIK